MKINIIITKYLLLILCVNSLLFAQEKYIKISEGTSSYDHYHCDCFQILNDSIIFREDKISSIYKGWDFSKYYDLSIETLLNDINKHFLLINFNIFNKKIKNEKKVRFLDYNFYKDTNSYYQLLICIGYNSMFDSRDDSTDIKKAFSIKDYCAYIKIINIDYSIEGYIELIKILNPPKGSKQEKQLMAHIKEEKKLQKKIDSITKKIRKGEIVLPSDNKK